MAYVAQLNGDVLIAGELHGLTRVIVPASTIVNASVSPSAAIAASKLQRSLRYSGMYAGSAVDETILAFFIKGTTATFKHFTVSNITANAGDSEVDVDVQLDGVSILADPVTLTSSTGAYSENEGEISTTTGSDGSYVTIVLDATASGTDALAIDVFWQLDYDETYAS